MDRLVFKVINKVDDKYLKGLFTSNVKYRKYILKLDRQYEKLKSNQLTKFLEEYPNKNWNWNFISENPNITIGYIKMHPTFPWHFKNIFKNPNLTIDFILSNIGKINRLQRRINKTNVTFRVKTIIWNEISKNPGIKLKDIIDNPNLSWNWKEISKNPNLTLNFILSNLNKNWDFRYLGGLEIITIDFIDNTQDKKWDWHYISYNPNLTLYYVNNNLYRKWSFDGIYTNSNINIYDVFENFKRRCYSDYMMKRNFSKHPNITIEFIKEHPGKLRKWYDSIIYRDLTSYMWDWKILSSHENIKINDIIDNPQFPWDWYEVNKNPNLTMSDIINNQDKQWFFFIISKHPNILMEFIEINPNRCWDWQNVSKNPNLTFEFYNKYKNRDIRIIKFPNSIKEFDFNVISFNKFDSQ